MRKIYKPSLFFLSLIPLIVIVYKTFTNDLGPEPIKEITHHTGEWALLFIVFTLAMSPLKKITNLNILISFRGMFGLFAFFYASLHLMTYVMIIWCVRLHPLSRYVRLYIYRGNS